MSKTKIALLCSALVVSYSAFSSFSFAEYEVSLDLTDKKIYLTSGEVKISVDNVEQYFSSISTGNVATGNVST